MRVNSSGDLKPSGFKSPDKLTLTRRDSNKELATKHIILLLWPSYYKISIRDAVVTPTRQGQRRRTSYKTKIQYSLNRTPFLQVELRVYCFRLLRTHGTSIYNPHRPFTLLNHHREPNPESYRLVQEHTTSRTTALRPHYSAYRRPSLICISSHLT